MRKAGATFTDRQLADVTERQTADRAAGWTVLAGSMLAIAGSRLYDPNPATPEFGEFSDLAVPAGVIRDSLARAGGGQVGANVGRQGEVATGVLISEQVRENVGATQTGFVWIVGSPERPFEPHQELAGVSFKDWDDPELINDDDWPRDTPYYEPGDHEGCECSSVMTWTFPDE